MDTRRTTLRAILIGAVVAAVPCGYVGPLPALGAGVVIALTLGSPAVSAAAARHLLAWSVVALGFGIDLPAVLGAGRDGFVATAGMLALTFGFGRLLSRRLGLADDVALLITAGTAICGGSAIAAVAPLIRARSVDVAVAVAVVFVLNALALVVFPSVGAQLGLDAAAFGRWCALAIHDTSSVVGAASTYGRDALDIAAVTKLARALWIVPIGFLIVRARARAGTGESSRTCPVVPWFLVGFLLAAGLGSIAPSTQPIGAEIAALAPTGMTLALFAVGLGATPSMRRVLSRRTLVFAVMLWTLLATAALAYVSIASGDAIG